MGTLAPHAAPPAGVDDAFAISLLPSGEWAIINRVPIKDIVEKVRSRGQRPGGAGALAEEPGRAQPHPMPTDW